MNRTDDIRPLQGRIPCMFVFYKDVTLRVIIHILIHIKKTSHVFPIPRGLNIYNAVTIRTFPTRKGSNIYSIGIVARKPTLKGSHTIIIMKRTDDIRPLQGRIPCMFRFL